MTSVLNVDTIADKAGTGPVGLTKQTAPKARVLYNQDSPAVLDSFNISSMLDSSTGFFDMNLSSAMGSTNYVCHFNATVVNSHVGQALDVRNAASDTNASRIEVFYAENNSAQDSTRNNLSLLGDLA